MLVYYRFCHPSGPIYCCPPTQEYSLKTPHTELVHKNSGLYKVQVCNKTRFLSMMWQKFKYLREYVEFQDGHISTTTFSMFANDVSHFLLEGVDFCDLVG